MRVTIILLVALASAALLGGCPQRQPAAGGDPAGGRGEYIVTVTPLMLILAPLVGEVGRVGVLLKQGVSAHTYEPQPSDAAACWRARAFFYVGAGYDDFAARLEARQKVELMALLPAEEKLPAIDHRHAAADEGAPAAYDPHFFTDPLAVKALLPALTEQLCRIDPGHAPGFRANAAAFALRLDALADKTATELEPYRGRAVFLMHPSFAYYMRRFGLKLAGVVEEFPGKEPSPRYLQEMKVEAKAQGVRAVLTETLLPRAPAEALAEATGLRLGELDPSCGSTARSYKSYEDWLRYNTGVFVAVLK